MNAGSANDLDALGQRTLNTLAAPVATPQHREFASATGESSFVPAEPPVDPRQPLSVRQPRSTRITGIDAARGVAMFGMVIVHFVNFREDRGERLTEFAELFNGRAMPLFMLLGGIGVTFLTRRSSTPERDLTIRALLLFALGLFMSEHVPRLAIVLQAYGLFFILSTVLYRLPSKLLVALVPVVTAVGAVTYQLVGDPPVQTLFGDLGSGEGIQSLLFDGFYPLFPVGAFFILGIVLGRIDLRSDRVACALAGVGIVAGVGIPVLSNGLVERFGWQTDFGGRLGDGMFHFSRLLDSTGHSAMPAWVLSALGTSVAVLGLSLLIAPRVPMLVRPIVAVGSMSLTFYVYQAWLTNLVPPTSETSAGVEWILALAVYGSFVLFALLWQIMFRSGPLERVIRIGSGPRVSQASTTVS